MPKYDVLLSNGCDHELDGTLAFEGGFMLLLRGGVLFSAIPAHAISSISLSAASLEEKPEPHGPPWSRSSLAELAKTSERIGEAGGR